MIQEILLNQIGKATELFKEKLREELKAQGHSNTGKLEKSIAYDIELKAEKIVVSMFMNTYGVFMDTGVSPSKIPYSGRTGLGGRSKYIEGLISYFRSKGLNERNAKGAAFATATIQKREGMPTRNSYRHSSNGRRTGFVNEAWTSIQSEFEKIVTDHFYSRMSLEIENMIDKALKNAA
jgi:hypothetical protein